LDRREDSRIAQSHLERADALIKELGCSQVVHRNQLSRNGYEQRLIRFAESIKSAVSHVNEATIRECEAQQEFVAAHRISQQRRFSDQVARTEMAVRLLRWLRLPLPKLASFGEQSTHYVHDLAYADWAREAIC